MQHGAPDSKMFLWFLFIAVPVSYYVFKWRRKRLYQLAAQFPLDENNNLPLIGAAYSFIGSTEHILEAMQNSSYASVNHGGVVTGWIGPLLYFVVTEPCVLETVLKSSLEKDNIYRFMRQAIGNGSVFAPENSEKLSLILSLLTCAGQFSIWPYINACSFDATMETVMGVKINAQHDPDNLFLKAVNESQNNVSERMFHFWLHPDWLYRFHPKNKRTNECVKIMNDFVDEVIQRKRQQILDNCEVNDAKSFLDHLMSVNELEYSLSDVELREEVLMLIIAATDTSAVSIGFTLKLLAKYPDVQQKVFEELQKVLGDTTRSLQREDLINLEYLHRVIQESLRLYPSVPFVARKIESETILHDGSILPAGSGFIASIWGMQRNPKYWGQDADCFDPDRFMPHRLKLPQSCCYLPFSFGPRNCIGYQYAMMSMKTTLATILRNYKIIGEPESGPKPHIRVKLDIMMKAVDGYKVALQRR